MAGDILRYLQDQLAAGPLQLGQVLVTPDFSLRHRDDEGAAVSMSLTSPADAIEIARYDDAGKYRPLKTAPNLRHGWELRLKSAEEVLVALDYLYPAAVGTALRVKRGEIVPVPFRTTLARQSGMYAVVKKLTDQQACDLIQTTCHAGCLRQILWSISTEQAPMAGPSRPAGEQPIYCVEACNLLVAVGRPIAKGNSAAP